MKLLLLSLALVAVALCQDCDSDNGLITSWASYQDGSAYTDSLWEDKELIGWGMDGNNKWNDFWLRTSSGVSHYSRVTCSTTSQTTPAYNQVCGDCSLTADFDECNCYPYYDVAESYQESPKPHDTETTAAETPEGWPTDYLIGNPPFESTTDDTNGPSVWSAANCKQYKPAWVYYYTYKLKIRSDGVFEASYGISKGFEPSTSAWEDFCEDVFQNTNQCIVPSDGNGGVEPSFFGSRYRFDKGFWRANDEDDIQFFHRRFENGCHAKVHNHRWPTANYCGDDSGWRFGAGTTAHVRFGCDIKTFFDTETDYDNEVDDEDCSSIYILFDQMNNLTVTTSHYDTYEWVIFSALSTPISDTDCWYSSTWTDHRTETPSYRTPCSASGLAVPFVALMSIVMMVVMRNI